MADVFPNPLRRPIIWKNVDKLAADPTIFNLTDQSHQFGAPIFECVQSLLARRGTYANLNISRLSATQKKRVVARSGEKHVHIGVERVGGGFLERVILEGSPPSRGNNA